MKVLVSDPLSDVGVEIFQETPGIDVDVNTGLTPEELKGIIGLYDGLVIRSATRVTPDILEAADRLKVIGRAGIGLDNVDIPAASQRGIVVMNTPDWNTITTKNFSGIDSSNDDAYGISLNPSNNNTITTGDRSNQSTICYYYVWNK